MIKDAFIRQFIYLITGKRVFRSREGRKAFKPVVALERQTTNKNTVRSECFSKQPIKRC